ncbi:response regulator [Actinokineospora spheciospongiae]|uniref:response regulator n=1 Tax=Actinokineospora spheciospongiae TaxID=909613 RepID=UPI000D70F2B7|nr:response regulator [Actinokineospora spheciospongiae]PWW63361.1 response regulator of citrate/malate metabolism [Actinokineospora spheciospongiae]
MSNYILDLAAPLRVLVVDGDRTAAGTHRGQVEGLPGFTVVTTTHTASAARRALVHRRVDLVLLDPRLPDGSGVHLLRWLRATGLDVDVIAVADTPDPAGLRACVSLGVLHYLLKPLTGEHLRHRLVRYAQYRAAAGGFDGQEDVDRAMAVPRTPPAPPGGISGSTLDTVRGSLRAAGGGGLTAVDLAARVGLSRVTARRYLEYMVLAGSADRVPYYGTVGRPRLHYRWLGA